jgi:hypothetical protein
MALAHTARATTQTRTLYFCAPKAGGSTQQSSQHYLTGPSAERWSYNTANAVSSKTKDAATSATVNITSTVTVDIKCLVQFEKPITTVWAEAAKRKGLDGIGAKGLENNDWQI